MGRTYIGYGYTNSEGVATLDYDSEGNQLPKKSYACHSKNTSVVAEASIDNVITSSNCIRFCENYVPPSETLSLTADKSILSYADNDSCTLTATFESADSVSGKSVVFKVGDTVLDTVQTDSEGVAEYTYNSQGVGDVTFTVECMNLQETYELQDYYYYDSLTVDKQRYVTVSGSPILTYSSNGLNVNSNVALVGLVKNNFLTLPMDYEAEITITSQTGSGGGCGLCFDDLLIDSGGDISGALYKLSNTSRLVASTTKFNTNDVVKIIKQGTTFKYYVNDDLKNTVTVSDDNHLQQFRTYNNRSTTFKDLKVKPL